MGEALSISAPRHVPPERIVDVDIYDLPGAGDDVHRAWRALARDHDLVWTPRNGGHWIATGGELIMQIYRDTDRFSNREIAVPAGSMLLPTLPIQADGAEHKAYRAIIEPAFRPAAIEAYGRKARALTVELIEGFLPAGRCEFIGDYALVLPLVIFLSMMDLPLEDRAELHGYTRVMTHDADLDHRHAAFRGVIAYLERKIAERRKNLGDDLFSRVLTAEVFGRPLTHEEVLGVATLLLFGGLDTVASMMGFVMRFLAEHPEHRRWFLEPHERTQVSFALEEIMRRHGVASNLRTAVEDTTLDGAPIRAGEHILVPTALYGLDPREFDRPEEVDFNRPGKPAATFGVGVHRCPGAGLARLEMRIMVEEWMPRIPEFWVAADEPAVQRSGGVNGILRLPLRRPTT